MVNYNPSTMIEVPTGYAIALTHLHTRESDGMVTPRQLVDGIDKAQQRLGVPIVGALTNHDTIKGTAEALKIASCRCINLMAGQEISMGTWPSKHALAYWKEEPRNPIPHGRTAEWTIDAIKSSGGLVVPAHANGYGGLGSLTAKEIANLGNKGLIDGIETINGSNDRSNGLKSTISELSKDKPFAVLGGSDSHYGEMDLFTSYTLFPGETVDDFFTAVGEGTTIPVVGERSMASPKDKVAQFLYSNVTLNVRRYILQNL